MLGIHARPQINKVTEPVARRLVAWGVTPDALTVVGTLGVAGGALAFYPRGHFFVGTLVITAFVFSDMLDGRGRPGPWHQRPVGRVPRLDPRPGRRRRGFRRARALVRRPRRRP